MKSVKRETDCWVWPYSTNSDGYGHLGKGKEVIDAYKYIYEMIVGKVPVGCELDHTCGNRLCVNPAHLEPVSHAENCRRGKNGKLKTEEILQIRQMAGKHTQREIAEKFGISRAYVGMILQGKRQHLAEQGILDPKSIKI